MPHRGFDQGLLCLPICTIKSTLSLYGFNDDMKKACANIRLWSSLIGKIFIALSKGLTLEKLRIFY